MTLPHRRNARAVALLVALVVTAAAIGSVGRTAAGASSTSSVASADAALDAALEKFVAAEGGPPGIAVVVQRGETPTLHTAGVADLATGAPIGIDDSMRLASVAKAFSGAAALSLVGEGAMSLDDTIGELLPDLPARWADITLTQLLQHTSGLPDFSATEEFRDALVASIQTAPPPRTLVEFVADDPLLFQPGRRYHYSNTDNIVVGLMIEAATGQAYEEVLAARVYEPLALTRTSLPADTSLPAPVMRGYSLLPEGPPEDATEAFAPGWAWASGGVVSTPADATRFARGYVSGKTTTPAVARAQRKFRPGSSEPKGPGVNSAGLALFRYKTKCGTVYGHTGNTAGYTQFIAADLAGERSVTVSINAQIVAQTGERFGDLRRIFGLGVCAALADE